VPFAVSVELNPRTFAALEYNLSLNNFHMVEPLNAGIAGEPGTLAFREGSCSLSDSIFQQTGSEENAEMVPILTLDDVVERYKVSTRDIDLLKLDCEGAEYSIIRTASPQRLRQFKHIIIEIHEPPPSGENLQALTEKLMQAGFKLVAQKPRTFSLMFWRRTD
jgi:FkbM family methyltransferase